MKQKRQKHAETLFTSYLENDEHFIWLAEQKNPHLIRFIVSNFWGCLVFLCLLLIALSFIWALIGESAFFTFILCCLPLSLFLYAFHPKTYYAISNQRLFTFRLSKAQTEILKTTIETLGMVQQVRISEDRYKTFSLKFEAVVLMYGIHQGLERDKPVIFAAKHFEKLDWEDAILAYNYLTTERAYRAEYQPS